MATTHTKSDGSKPRVGQRARFRFSYREVEGVITENYGPIGRNGQDVYEIVAPQELAEPITAVLPASEFTLVSNQLPEPTTTVRERPASIGRK